MAISTLFNILHLLVVLPSLPVCVVGLADQSSSDETISGHYSNERFLFQPQSPRAVSTSTSLLSVTPTTAICPDRCDCFNSDETVDCSRRGIESFPAIGNTTRRLYVEDNRLATLANAGLRLAKSLTLLVVERNVIDHVDAIESLCGLDRLQEINLGANRIRRFTIELRRQPEVAIDGELVDCRLTALKEINLGLNLLVEIPRNLSALAPNLEILNLGYNEIERATLDESFSELVALRYLDLSRNRIHEIEDMDLRPAAFVVPLEVLSLTECGLVSVSERAFAGLSNLTSFSISNNPIWIWSFGPAMRNLGVGVPSGESVDEQISGASVVNHQMNGDELSATSGDLSGQTSFKVQEEWLTNNPSLPPQSAPPHQHQPFLPLFPQQYSPLARLDLSEMILPNLTVDALGRFVNLIVLDASYCEIEFIEPHLFDRLSNLETLHLEGGKLERVDNLVALRRLRRLHLQENWLTTAVDLRGLYSLEMIDLSRNKIETIPAVWLTGLRGLQVLNLSHNLIRAIEPDSFHQVSIISTLDLSFNRLTTLEAYGLIRLERLDVSYNAIDRIVDDAFTELHQTLTDLDLGHNRLTVLNGKALGRAHGLLTLDLRHNNLHSQMEPQSPNDVDGSSEASDNPFQSLLSLETLDLSENSIDSIDCRQMASLPRLVSLTLRGNRLTDLQSASVACFPPSLVRLDVSANRLTSIDVVLLRGLDRLEELDIADNPFDCAGCRLESFFRWVNATPGLHLSRTDRIRCRHDDVTIASSSSSSSFIFDSSSYRWSFSCDSSSNSPRDPSSTNDRIAAAETDQLPSAARRSGVSSGRDAVRIALVATTVVGLSLGAVCAALVWKHRRSFQRFGKLHCLGRHWQVRYREVSNLETMTSSLAPTATSTLTCTNAAFGPVDSAC